MNTHNHTNLEKSIFFISLFVISIITLGLFTPIVDALHPVGFDSITKSLDTGTNTVSFRDITNIASQTDADGNSVATISFDASTAIQGFITITATDADANLDTSEIDLVLSSITSTTSGASKATAILTETGVNTGTFSGPVNIVLSSTTGNNLQASASDALSVFYDPEPEGVGRLSVQLTGVDVAGSVKITDVLVKDSIDECSAGFDLLTHPVNLVLTTSMATGASVTLSYANADIQDIIADPIDDATFLQMLHRAPGDIEFVSLTPPDPNPCFFGSCLDLSGHDFGNDEDGDGIAALTITNVDPPSQVEGQYALGYTSGCSGGGGGGLVRPGLVVNALAGVGALSGFFGGGGGAGPNAPTVLSGSILSLDGTEFFDAFDSVEGIEGILSNTENSFDSTQTVNTNEPLTFVFDLYENGGINNLEHATLYMNIRGDETNVDFSDTYILFDRGQSTHIIDPHGFIENANFEILEKTAWDLILKYDITFAKPMETSHIIIQSWDLDRNSSTKIFENALQVGDPNTIQVTQEITEEIIPEPEIQQLTSEDVPIWVKNNAGWWSQELIDDSDFIAGIQYLIQNKIIIILDDQVVTSSETSYQIPQWVKNNAGWWSEDLITEKDFTEGLQWLISNGVIRVQ